MTHVSGYLRHDSWSSDVYHLRVFMMSSEKFQQHQEEQLPSAEPGFGVPQVEEGRKGGRRGKMPLPPTWDESEEHPPWLPSAPWKIDGDPDYVPGDGKHWKTIREALADFDNDTIDGWKDEIQTQLLVSSLLAAVTGAFIIETQKDLVEHPVLAAALILSQIALQFNQSITLPKSSTSPFDGPSPTSRAINSLFYTSLGFSLANVTIGLLCLQWLRELKAESPGIPRQGYPAFRYNRHLGFQVWGAKGTILALPLLLLASLLSFFVALLFLTSSMDWLSSSPLYIILVSVLFFVLATTVIPGLVAVKYGAFHVGFSDVAPSPPFRSLQSWIVLQGLVKLIALYYRTIKRTARHRFVEISLCPDWGRIDQLWAGWANGRRDASMILPLVLSTGKKEDQEAIYQCYSDTYSKFEKPPPGGKRLDIYRKFVRYGRRLPAPTLKQVEDQLVSHVAALLNSGRSLQDIGGLGIEVNMDMFYITSEPLLQFMNALVQAFHREAPSGENEWNLLWHTMAACVPAASHFEMSQPWTVPPLFMDVLDLIERSLNLPHIDNRTILGVGYYGFIGELLDGMRSNPYITRNPVGKRVVSTVVNHPVWARAKEMAYGPGSDDWRLAGGIRRFTTHIDNIASQIREDERSAVSNTSSRISAAGDGGGPAFPEPNPYMIDMPDAGSTSSRGSPTVLQPLPSSSVTHIPACSLHHPISPGSWHSHHEDDIEMRPSSHPPTTDAISGHLSSFQRYPSYTAPVERQEDQEYRTNPSSHSLRLRPADAESGYYPSYRKTT